MAGKKKVLIVDDESDFLSFMEQRIHSWGYRVLTAPDGKEALEIFARKNPDIIILDYLMPGMDGVATLQEVRQIDKEIPVIMLTAHPDEKSVRGTEKLGVSSYIPKLSPYSDAQSALKVAIDMVVKKMNKKK